MKSDRNPYMQQMMAFPGNTNMPGAMPNNMMMFPNYMNESSGIDSRINMLEKKIRVMENKIARLESTCNSNYQSGQSALKGPYQTTQNSENYNSEMYMM